MAANNIMSISLKKADSLSIYLKPELHALRDKIDALALSEDRSRSHVCASAIKTAYNIADDTQIASTLKKLATEEDRSLNYLVIKAMESATGGVTVKAPATKKTPAKKAGTKKTPAKKGTTAKKAPTTRKTVKK